VACGILQEADHNMLVLKTETTPLEDSSVTAEITAVAGYRKAGEVCFFGSASGLERELVSFNADPVGTDCTAVNGCGVHVHRGESCLNTLMQGGHYYSTAEDPWTATGYLTTNGEGSSAIFFNCVSTGETEFEGRAFLVHSDDGSRVSCGLLVSKPHDMMNMNMGGSPTAAPASSGLKLAPLASALAMLTAAVIAVTL
jgi:hypothetical protein